MNLQIHHVLRDLTGMTGLAILDALLGERDRQKLAALRDPRVQSSAETLAQALEGDYRAEHLFTLRQSLEAYRFGQTSRAQCDRQVEALLKDFDPKVDPVEQPLPPPRRGYRQPRRHEPRFDLRPELDRISGVDLTQIRGWDVLTAPTLLSEIGLDLNQWPSEKHFASW